MKLHYGDKVEMRLVEGETSPALSMCTVDVDNYIYHSESSNNRIALAFAILPHGNNVELGDEIYSMDQCELRAYTKTNDDTWEDRGDVFVRRVSQGLITQDDVDYLVYNKDAVEATIFTISDISKTQNPINDNEGIRFTANGQHITVSTTTVENCGQVTIMGEDGRDRFSLRVVDEYSCGNLDDKFLLPLGIAIIIIVGILAAVWFSYQIQSSRGMSIYHQSESMGFDIDASVVNAHPSKKSHKV